MPAEETVVTSFCGRQLAGNRHRICLTRENPRSQTSAAQNIVFLRLDRAQPEVSFVSAHTRVQRCGSGTLAVAAYLYHHHYKRPFHSALTTDAGTVELGYDRQGPYYFDTPAPQRSIRASSLWQHLSASSFVGARYIGGPSDYCLVHLADKRQLQRLKPRLAQFFLYTRRALIVAAGEAPCPGMRYFAPQYGALEDRATGSAAVQLAHYFFATRRCTHLTIRQMSPGGGLIHSQVLSPGRVRIRGLCQLDD